MRYSEIASVPSSAMEAYNSVLDIIAVYISKNKKSIPMATVMTVLHNQGFDVTPKMIMDYLKSNVNIKNISKDAIYLISDESDMGLIPDDQKDIAADHIKDMADSELNSIEDRTKNKKHVQKLAKKALGKA